MNGSAFRKEEAVRFVWHFPSSENVNKGLLFTSTVVNIKKRKVRLVTRCSLTRGSQIKSSQLNSVK